MSSRGKIFRYSFIIKHLKAQPNISLKDLQQKVERDLEQLKDNDDLLEAGKDKRTLQRDFREIRNLAGIDIVYNKKAKGYSIAQQVYESESFKRMMEAFDVFNSFKQTAHIAQFVHLEKRQPQGTENLYGIIHAIKKRLKVEFLYKKYWETEHSLRKVAPYAIKEFRNRWYLLGKDEKDGHIKTFALDDRLSDFAIGKAHFDYPKDFSADNYFRNCFGVINSDHAPEEVILSFNEFQGKYIKALRLHETQEILLDTPQELRVRLRLHITFDFEMELLSLGDNVKVLQPQHLADKIRDRHRTAAEKYV
jgi:predicted DNA-binding transcriptional regulator YafY